MDRRTYLSLMASAALAEWPCSMGWAQDLAQVAETASEPLILGMDCHSYPGDRALATLRAEKGYRVTCLYLTHAPGVADPGWLKKRQFLQNSSWGLFPTYLGSQISAPDPTLGGRHGKEAAGLMKQAGFSNGSVIYLDIETPKSEDKFGPYLKEWMKIVRSEGWYPGVYGSYLMVPWLTKYTSAIWTVELPVSKEELLANLKPDQSRSSRAEQTAPRAQDVLRVDEIASFLENYNHNRLLGANDRAYNPNQHPHGLIRPSCVATQYLWYQRVPGLTLDPGIANVFDLNWSLVADPSDATVIANALRVTTLK